MEASLFHAINTKRDEELPFYITSIGTTPAEYKIYRPSGIDSYQILYTKKGKGITKIFDRWLAVPERSLMILPPNIPHFYEMQGEIWETCWITFSGWGTEQLFCVNETVVPVPEEVCFLEKFNNLSTFWKNEPWNVQNSAYLYSLLLDCRELIPKESVIAYNSGEKIKLCFEYIHKNYMKVIELSCLSQICGITGEHLCRIFKQYTGMRPFEYITKIRLQRAKEMLILQKNMKISDIAELSGFQSSSYFSAVFLKNEGVTPGQFRERVV